jgi:hypothetical protein
MPLEILANPSLPLVAFRRTPPSLPPPRESHVLFEWPLKCVKSWLNNLYNIQHNQQQQHCQIRNWQWEGPKTQLIT